MAETGTLDTLDMGRVVEGLPVGTQLVRAWIARAMPGLYTGNVLCGAAAQRIALVQPRRPHS